MQKKYIIIPFDFKPLFALRRKLGPSMGPIKKPILCDIKDIHDLLMQRHGNELQVFEVELTNGELRQDYHNPVRLTLENYNLPYSEIYAMEHNEDKTEQDSSKDSISQTSNPVDEEVDEVYTVSETYSAKHEQVIEDDLNESDVLPDDSDGEIENENDEEEMKFNENSENTESSKSKSIKPRHRRENKMK